MAELIFETGYLSEPVLTIQGDVSMLEEEHPGGALGGAGTPPFGANPMANKPYNIIQADQALSFAFRWKTIGILPTVFPVPVIWHLRVLFERIGGTGVVPNPPTLVLNWPAVLDTAVKTPPPLVAAAGSFVPVGPHETGENIFRVVATAVMHNAAEANTPIAGFCDLGFIQVYED